MGQIRDEDEYRAALAEIERFLAVAGDAPEGPRFDALIEPVEVYEAEHFAADPDPTR